MVAELLSAAGRRKPVRPPAQATSSSALDDAEKPLGLVDLVGIGVGGTLGSGLFLLAGHAARDVAGPAVAVSFALGAVACLFSGLSYAEMSSRDPDCGGAYAFAYTALGELPAFLVGSCLTLEYGVASAAIARSWASYLGEAVGFLPGWAVGRGGGVSVFGGLLVLGITWLLAGGMKEAKWVINGSTLLYAAVVCVIVVVGAFDVDLNNWSPFLPFGVTGVLAGASHVFFSFIGFDEVATVAEEARDAANSVPMAMMLSLAIVAVIYVAATLVLTGMVNYVAIDLDAPFSAAFNVVHKPIIAKLVGIGTATGMINTTLVSLAAQPRIFVSMGRDGLLPSAIASTMRATTIRCGVFVSVFALAVPTEVLADVVSGGTLLAFLATNLALMHNRVGMHDGQGVGWTNVLAVGCMIEGAIYRFFTMHLVPFFLVALAALPLVALPVAAVLRLDMRGGGEFEEAPPMFLCPFVPALPVLGVVTTTFLMTQLPGQSLAALGGWLVVSALIYVFYGMHHSRAGATLLRPEGGEIATGGEAFGSINGDDGSLTGR